MDVTTRRMRRIQIEELQQEGTLENNIMTNCIFERVKTNAVTRSGVIIKSNYGI